jgi:hypothetical protein
MPMELHEKRSAYDKNTAIREHGIDVPPGAIWPEDVLEDLFRENQIKPLFQYARADIEFRIVDGRVALETSSRRPFGAGDLEHRPRLWLKLHDRALDVAIHRNPQPLVVRSRIEHQLGQQRAKRPPTWAMRRSSQVVINHWLSQTVLRMTFVSGHMRARATTT